MSTIVCDDELVDAGDYLFLGIRISSLSGPIHLQPTSIQFYGLHHRLSRVSPLDVPR